MSAGTGDILISDGGVTISRANALQFVRTDNQSGTLQTLDNRNLADISINNVSSDWNYMQKFKIADIIPTQISTIYTIDSFKVYNFLTDALLKVSSLKTKFFKGDLNASETFQNKTIHLKAVVARNKNNRFVRTMTKND